MFWHHLGIPPGTPPKWTLQILILCSAQTRVPVFFDINRYNRQIFQHSLRVPLPPRDPPRWTPKSNLCTTKFTMPVFLITVDISEANILTEFGNTTILPPPTIPPNGPPIHQFFYGLSYSTSFYLILWNTEKTNSWTCFESAALRNPQMNPTKINFRTF